MVECLQYFSVSEFLLYCVCEVRMLSSCLQQTPDQTRVDQTGNHHNNNNNNDNNNCNNRITVTRSWHGMAWRCAGSYLEALSS